MASDISSGFTILAFSIAPFGVGSKPIFTRFSPFVVSFNWAIFIYPDPKSRPITGDLPNKLAIIIHIITSNYCKI